MKMRMPRRKSYPSVARTRRLSTETRAASKESPNCVRWIVIGMQLASAVFSILSQFKHH
jgi:hypothetical protein